MMVIDVTNIRQGLPGISPVSAAHLYEAFEVVMHRSGHPQLVDLNIVGITNESIGLSWSDGYDEQKARTYADIQYATEHGAVCLSVMLTKALTPYTVIERSRRGTGIDYWLGDAESLLFQRKARLEVSGIFKGDETELSRRYAQKALQTSLSDSAGIPAYISVVEFSTPKAQFNIK